MNFLSDWKDYLLVVFGSVISLAGVVSTTIFSNRREIDGLKVTVDYLVKSKNEHEHKIDNALTEIRNDIKNLLRLNK